MLLSPDRKKVASVIVASMGKKPSDDYVQSEAGESEDDMGGDPKVVAARALLKAIAMKDAKRLAMAFEELASMCGGDSEYYGGEESEPEDAGY